MSALPENLSSKRSADQDPSAIATEWFQAFGDDLFAFAVRRLGRTSFSEDVVQDTFLTAIECLRRGEEVESPRGFLVTILRRKIIDHLRRERRRSDSMAELKATTSCDITEQSLGKSSFLTDVTPAEFHGKLRECVAKLPLPMRQAFELRVIRRIDVTEAADLLGVTRNALAARLYRSRLAVRDCLGDMLED